jgi:hypothetical protein
MEVGDICGASAGAGRRGRAAGGTADGEGRLGSTISAKSGSTVSTALGVAGAANDLR